MAQSHSTDLESSSSQYWSITDASQSGLDITGDISISLWVKFESLPTSGNNLVFVSKYGYENNQRAYYFSIHNNSGTYRLRFANSQNGSSFTEGNVTWSGVSTGTWYQIGVSKSSTTATMYVNGSSIGTASVNNSQFDSSATFAVGILVGGSGGTDSPFDGLIDDVLIYNAAIGSNMNTNYTTPCSPYTTNAVSQWKFNNNGDDSIGSNTLTNNNSATFSTDVPFTCTVTVPDLRLAFI